MAPGQSVMTQVSGMGSCRQSLERCPQLFQLRAPELQVLSTNASSGLPLSP